MITSYAGQKNIYEVILWNKKSDEIVTWEIILENYGLNTIYRKKSCVQSFSAEGVTSVEAHMPNTKPVN